jgi:hypothetical protein
LKKKIKEIKIMKIAIFFSGRITGYEECIKPLLEVKEKSSTEIVFFVSLNLPRLTQAEQEFLKILNISEDRVNIEETPEHPPWVDEHVKKSWKVVMISNAYSSLYHNRKSWKLITSFEEKNKIKFDIVVKYRADILSNTFIPLEVPTKNTIYIPIANDHYGITDQIAYGDREVMKVYSTLFDRLEEICLIRGCEFHPETLVKFNIEQSDLEVKRINFSYVLNPKRFS